MVSTGCCLLDCVNQAPTGGDLTPGEKISRNQKHVPHILGNLRNTTHWPVLFPVSRAIAATLLVFRTTGFKTGPWCPMLPEALASDFAMEIFIATSFLHEFALLGDSLFQPCDS